MKNVSLVFFLFISALAFTQEDSLTIAPRITTNGYIKFMPIFSFGGEEDKFTFDQLVHHRLNFRYQPSAAITAGLEFRNRLFTGESIQSIEGYGDLLDTDPGVVDLSFLIVNNPSMVLLSQIDRAWLNWNRNDWEITVGRQRINWGINLFCNSNDLFNVFSLVDFDYEERPGADALRVRRYFNSLKSVELAFAPGTDQREWIGALMYRFNQWKYDFQLLAGKWDQDLVIGGGWAGNIGLAGFKGEVSWFHPLENRSVNTDVLSASISADYVFSNQLFLTLGYLFNSQGIDTTLSEATNLFTDPLSAKSLMPSMHSVLASASVPLATLYGGSLTMVYSPGVNTALFMMSLNYSFAANWELALFGQSFWLDTDGFDNIGNGVFVRLKGSY